jgi:3-hydroxyisobutyrate dehydrogenase-like beta-hydroxyacid dehydrogenase
MSNVGFIGLGRMGSEMARRFVEAGHDVLVWNRSKDAGTPLVEAGARMAADPSEALAADVAFSMLADDAAVDSVFSDEYLSGAKGATHINMATISPAMAHSLAERHHDAGVRYAAAPVLGGPDAAAKGQLHIFAAGATDVIDSNIGLFHELGQRVWRIGEIPEQANLVKIGVNYNLIHAIQTLAESINLIEKGGIDAHTFVRILTETAFTGTAYKEYGSLIADRSYLPAGFSPALGLKDLALAQAAARERSAALPTATAIRDIFETALSDEDLAKLDWSAIAEVTRRRTA